MIAGLFAYCRNGCAGAGYKPLLRRKQRANRRIPPDGRMRERVEKRAWHPAVRGTGSDTALKGKADTFIFRICFIIMLLVT
jgi:hypothetical protein